MPAQVKPSSKKRLEQQVDKLLQYQAQADALFASIGDGAIATDEEGKINKINQSALDMLGYTEEEVLGEWFPKVIIAEDDSGNRIDTIHRSITQAFLSGKAITNKVVYRCKNGMKRPVSITVSPIMLNGAPIGAVEVFRDITHEREVDRMKTEFIYLASHQLRTPLTAIKTYSHMLYDGYLGELTPEQKQFMRTAFSSLDRMNDIINTLLNISRIETGKIALTPSAFSMEEILLESLTEIQPSLEAKNIALTVKFDSLPKITSDSVLTKEICMNLLTNAVKYTPINGEITIRLVGDKDSQTFSVTDTGYGIPKEAQEKLFTKFFRAPNILDKEEGGSGLGLYLVKGLAEALGADVSFTSKEGKGSTFRLELPTRLNIGTKMEEM